MSQPRSVADGEPLATTSKATFDTSVNSRAYRIAGVFSEYFIDGFHAAVHSAG